MIAGNLKEDQGLNILLAEDNETLGYITTQQLQDEGHTVHHAVDGQKALAMAFTERFDVILMDISMPELCGIAVTKAIRASQGLNRDTYILALTSNASAADLKAYEAAGINSCLAKPVKKKTLIQALSLSLGVCAANPPPERLAHFRQVLAHPLIAVSKIGEFIAGRPLPRVLKTVEIFVFELDERAEKLRAAIQRGDADALQFLAHSLIGSSELLGAGRLADMSRAIEDDLKRGHPFELSVATELLAAMVQTADVFRAVECEKSLWRVLNTADAQSAPIHAS